MVADDNPSGESLQRRASGSASSAKMPDPDGTLTQKRSAAMSAHVLLSEHKQTSRGHRQINAIDPLRTPEKIALGAHRNPSRRNL
jgi:hypothetical protein